MPYTHQTHTIITLPRPYTCTRAVENVADVKARKPWTIACSDSDVGNPGATRINPKDPDNGAGCVYLSKTLNDGPDVFMTEQLNGCSIVITETPTHIVVAHVKPSDNIRDWEAPALGKNQQVVEAIMGSARAQVRSKWDLLACGTQVIHKLPRSPHSTLHKLHFQPHSPPPHIQHSRSWHMAQYSHPY